VSVKRERSGNDVQTSFEGWPKRKLTRHASPGDVRMMPSNAMAPSLVLVGPRWISCRRNRPLCEAQMHRHSRAYGTGIPVYAERTFKKETMSPALQRTQSHNTAARVVRRLDGSCRPQNRTRGRYSADEDALIAQRTMHHGVLVSWCIRVAYLQYGVCGRGQSTAGCGRCWRSAKINRRRLLAWNWQRIFPTNGVPDGPSASGACSPSDQDRGTSACQPTPERPCSHGASGSRCLDQGCCGIEGPWSAV